MRKFLVVAAAATVAVLGEPGALAATQGGVTLVSGVLSNAAGVATGGAVELFAWPDPLPATPGSTFTMIPISTTVAQPDGSYRFSTVDVSTSPAYAELQQIAAAENGWVNFQLLGATEGATGERDISRQMSPSGTWQHPGADSPRSNIRTNVNAADVKPNAILSQPADNPPKCTTQVLDSTYKYATVGQSDRWDGITARFFYEETADSEIDVGVSQDGTNWSVSGGVHVSNSGDRSNWAQDATAYGAQLFRSQFLFEKTQTTWNGVGACAQGYHVRARTWNGGMITGGTSENNYDGICNTIPESSGASVRQTVGGVQWTTRKGVHWSSIVHVFGADLGGQSGYTYTVKTVNDFQHQGWMCSSDGTTPLSDAHAYNVGPEY